MGFLGPKLAWLLLSPVNLIGLAAILALLLLATPWRRLGRAAMVLVTLAVALLTVLPVGGWLAWPLESRFPALRELPPAAQLGGIIVLGGAVRTALTARHGQPALNEGAERMTAAAALARHYADLPVVFTGGDASILGEKLTEAAVAEMVFAEIGLPPGRVQYEASARNTWENATLTYAKLRPAPERPWLLITSAAHMPRAVGCFRRAGWTVLPYPVDYQMTEPFGLIDLNLAGNMSALSNAAREWLGLAFYYVAGRTDALLPAPQDG